MLRLNLGGEPAELEAERIVRLPAAVTAFNDHGVGVKDFTDLLDRGYQVARSFLYERQHGKCAFCEKNDDEFRHPVEHFRPKKMAQNHEGNAWVDVKTHYWWLTWSWDNLYFVCDRCNMSGRKGSRFPIARNSRRVLAPSNGVIYPLSTIHFDTSAEKPLLIEPRRDNPFVHLQWTPRDARLPKSLWTWKIVGRDERGSMTISVLDLEGREDEVNRHLKLLRSQWKQVQGHLADNRSAEAILAWNDLVADFIEDVKQPYRNAAWWAADSLCSASERTIHHLRHPRLPEVS